MHNDKQKMLHTNNIVLILYTSRTRNLMQLSLNKCNVLSKHKLFLIYVTTVS